jgi:hypothetical protein
MDQITRSMLNKRQRSIYTAERHSIATAFITEVDKERIIAAAIFVMGHHGLIQEEESVALEVIAEWIGNLNAKQLLYLRKVADRITVDVVEEIPRLSSPGRSSTWRYH